MNCIDHATRDEKPVAELRVILKVTALSYSTGASVVGVSPSTLRIVLETGSLPERSDSRLRILRFVERNRGARSRADLRLV